MERAATTLDHVEIRRLVDRYAACMDALDLDGFEALWAPGAVLDVHEDGPSAPATGRLTAGRHFHLAFDRLGAYERTVHHVTTHVAQVDGGRAVGTTCCEAHHIERPGGPDTSDLVMHIRYDDRFVHHKGAWLFEHRRVGVLLREQRSVVEQR